MSIQALSTELDTKIAQFLVGDRHSLDSLSRVSRYYRQLSEPFLYYEILFTTAEEAGIRYLLRTLLDRRELGQHVHAIRLVSHEADGLPSDPKPTAFYDELWSRLDVIRDNITTIAGHYTSTEFRLDWLSKVIAGYPSYQGALAMVVCMAPNIVCLDIKIPGQDDLALLWKILRLPRGSRELQKAFGRLHTFRVDGYGRREPVPILPWMRYVCLKNCLVDRYRIAQIPHLLHELKIVDSYLLPQVLERAMAKGLFSNLRILMVHKNRYGGSSDTIDNYDFQSMNRVLRQHCPRMELLEWTLQEYEKEWGSVQHFGSFAEWISLTELRLDFQLFIGESGPLDAWAAKLADAHSLLPLSLRHLTITDMNSSTLDRLCKKYGGDPDKVTRAVEHFVRIVDKTSLRTLCLKVDMELHLGYEPASTFELGKSTRTILPRLTEALYDMGVELTVRRQVGPLAGKRSKLLYSPGFVAPLPHWSDVDQSNWCWRDQQKWGDRGEGGEEESESD